MGARPVLEADPAYPDRLLEALGRNAPPALCVAGGAGLLNHRPAVAIVGSREPSQTAAAGCRELARALGRAGHVVVSGGARGIDMLAHGAALPHGPVVVVSPVGLGHFRWRGGRPAPDQEWCLVSQFPPRRAWHNRQALLRNRVIVALADVVVAFEPRDRGGTWHSCNEALRMRRPLFVVNGAGDAARTRGQQSLVRRGAVAVAPHHMPAPEELLRMAAEHSPPDRGEQSGLFE
jgi:DNA processing protein